MLKTLKRKIALVAVAGLGAGLVSVAPANAAAVTLATSIVDFVGAGSTTAVTNDTGTNALAASTEVVSVRSTSASNTFKMNFKTLSNADTVVLYMATGTTVTTALNADLITLTAGTAPTGGTIGTQAITLAAGATAATKGLLLTEGGTGTVLTGVTFTTGALPAGIYTIWADANSTATSGGVSIATVTSYAVGAPVTVAFNKKYTTVGIRDGAYTTALKDSTSRSTFLIGDEEIVYSLDAVATTVKTIDTPASSTSLSASIAPTGGVFAPYAVALDADNADNTKDASVGVTYGLNAVIQVGVNSFGSTSTTYRFISTTNGLVGALSVTKAAVAVTTATLAQSDTIAVGDFLVKLVDSTGAVVEGVTPTLSVAAGATATLTSSVTGATGTGNALAATYTAPATGSSDTLTWTVTAGSAASLTASLAITLTTSVALAGNSAILSVAGNGGFISGTPVINADLTDGGALAPNALADPANTTKLTTGITVTLTAAPLTPQAAAVLSVSLSGTTPTANMTASATSITTDAAGKASVDVTVAAARATETVIVTIKSGAVTIGIATYTFTASAVTVTEVSMGPAQAITSKIGTATPVQVTVVDQYGQVKANQRIQLSVAGPSAPTAAPILLTGADGTATYSVTGTTAISGQTDIVTVTHLNAGAVTADANDVVTITYTSSEVAASTITVEYALDQNAPTFALQGTTAIATAITTVNTDTGADLNEALANLTPDTSGNWTDTGIFGIGGVDAAEDEVVRLRFTVKNAAGTALSGVKVTITAPAGGFIRSSATVKVATVDLFTNGSGQVTADVWSQKVGDAVFTAAVGTVTASQTIPYGTSNIAPTAARYVAVTPATASVAGGNAQLVTAKVTDRFGNPVKGVTVTFSELGTGRLTGTNAVTTAAGTSEIDFTSLVGETGTSVVTATIAGGQQANLATFVGLVAGTATAAFTSDATAGNATATSALTVTAGTAAADTANAAIKTDVATANAAITTTSAAVKTLATQVTVLQASVATLIDSLTTQIAALLQSVSDLTKAVAKMQADAAKAAAKAAAKKK